jgi:hypothetical protein
MGIRRSWSRILYNICCACFFLFSVLFACILWFLVLNVIHVWIVVPSIIKKNVKRKMLKLRKVLLEFKKMLIVWMQVCPLIFHWLVFEGCFCLMVFFCPLGCHFIQMYVYMAVRRYFVHVPLFKLCLFTYCFYICTKNFHNNAVMGFHQKIMVRL